MDALEFLRGDAPFIADTSAWWRFSSLPTDLVGVMKQAIADDRLWITPIVRMEILYSARGQTHRHLTLLEEDTTARCAQISAAREAWASIKRDDLVNQLTTEFPDCP